MPQLPVKPAASTPAEAEDYTENMKFPRFFALDISPWDLWGSRMVKRVDVTGLADSDRFRPGDVYWVEDETGKRSKRHGECLIEINEKTIQSINEIDAISTQIEALNEKKSKLYASMTRIKRPEGF